MVRLSFPLFLLGAIFTGIQLTNQINSMNEFYHIESRFAFDALHKALTKDLSRPETLANLPTFKEHLGKMVSFYRVDQIQIFDLLDRNSLFPDDPFEPSSFDDVGIEESLAQREMGKSYHVRVDKKSKKLIAYIPIEGPTKTQIWIVRIMFSLANVKDAIARSQWTLGIMIFFITLAGIAIGQGLARSIVKPIRTLNDATQAIMEGELGKHVEINTGDEIEALAHTFNHMSEALKVMKKQAEDANPLTQLPGNHAILIELKKRILERQKFVLFHTDLDRFKTFNDHYGLAHGDEAIKKTAGLLRKAVKEKGSPDDFVGHQGGDDFVIITRPNYAKELAELVCSKFESDVVRSLYPAEDFARGFTLQLDRRRLAETGEERMVQFPLLAISLAGVSNAKRDFADYFDCMSAAVTVKKEVKKIVQSSYMIQE